MKKLLKFLAYTLFFVLALMFFTPKISTYYFLEQQIKPFGVVVSHENLNDKGLSLEIENADVSFKAIDSAQIENINIKLYALYNSVSAQNITLSSTAASFIPLHVSSVNILYSIIDPLAIKGYIEGDFGEAEARYNIVENSVHIVLTPSDTMRKNYKSTLRTLSKNENGEYIYDKAF